MAKNNNITLKIDNVKLVLGTLLCTSLIMYKSYDKYLDYKLQKIEFNVENIDAIKDTYDNNIDIFVMNDSQCINLNIGFWKDSCPEYLEEELDAKIIDASSLRYNKTSHINMLLDNNLSVKEIKELNNEGIYSAIEKAIIDSTNSKILGMAMGNISEALIGSEIEENDENINITDEISQSKNPIIIYSSGANDLMFLANANPSSIYKYDNDGNISNKYLYANEKLEDEETLNTIFNGIEENIKKLISINSNCTIYALSIYVPQSLRNEELSGFEKAINNYNTKLSQLCQKYNMVYINMEDLANTYNYSNSNFHIDEVGHKALASVLIDEIAKRSIVNNNDKNQKEYLKKGLIGFYNDLYMEYENLEKIDDSNYYTYVYNQQKEEKKEDADICYKVLKKNK